METFSTSSALHFGWETFKKRPWFLVGATVVGLLLSGVVSSIHQDQNVTGSFGITSILFLVSFVLSILVDMGITAFVLRAHDDISHASLRDLWHPQPFWYYFIATFLVGVSVVAGFILLIIPGIILILMLAFVKYIVIDRGLGPIEAMKESARITKGQRWELLLFFLALLGLNVLGVLALFIGLLVTGPISMLALAHAYRTLSLRINTPRSL